VPSHHDSLVTSSTSHSSSSSTQDSPFPPTPSDSYVGPFAKEKTVPDLVASHDPLSSPQRDPVPSVSVPTNDTARVKSQPSDVSTPPLSSPVLTSGLRIGTDDAKSSRVSVSVSDGAADIGLSMLQGFLAGYPDDDDDDDSPDVDADGDDKSERTSLDDTVDGFPAPPTEIPATSFVLDALRPPSALSEYSEDGDGASFYDNYCYSRLSISSKMSKSSAHAFVTAPPPVPTELPPSVRPSLESMPTSPLANESMPASPTSPLSTARPQTRTVPTTSYAKKQSAPHSGPDRFAIAPH
jgi:hypothetical protein